MIIIPETTVIESERETGIGANFDFGDTAGASALDVLIRSPLSSIVRSGNLDFAEMADRGKPKMTSEEFKKSEFFRPGLEFPKGVGVNVARLVADRKDSENMRNFVIRQGSSQLSAFGKVGLFGTNLMAAMLDPINVGSAFIPIVGQARFASMAARTGVTGARAAKGVTEGVVGAALVEPFVLFAANQEQADYDSMDSLLNIGFGGVFGAGLHVAAGKIGDIIRGDTPEIRELKVRTAVAQALDGQRVDIDPITKVNEDVVTSSTTGLEIPAREKAIEPLKEILLRDGKKVSNEDIIVKMDGIVNSNEPLTKLDKEFIAEVNKSPELQKLSETLQKVEKTTEDLEFIQSFKERSGIQINEKIAEIDKKLDKAKAREPKTDKGKKAKATRIRNLEKQKADLQEPKKSKSDFTEEQITNDVEATFKPEASSTYEKSDIDMIDEVIDRSKRSDLKQELADSEKTIENLKEQGVLKDADLLEYNESVKLLKDINKMEGVIDAIAVCVTR